MTVQAPSICRTVEAVREELRAARATGRTVALVPTMGALHDGHLALIARAREEADLVVVSIFVNPAQFNDLADLQAYPRALEQDCRLAADAGAAVIFAPDAAELYPDGFATQVRVTGPLTETLEGAHRGAAHFHGVTTVVTLLLTITAPDVAVFGAKDAQQVRVIERLVRDLRLPVRVLRAPTVREADGLALSSRNVRLNPAARRQATALSAALFAARDAYDAGAREADAILGAARHVLAGAAIEPEYLALCDADDLTPLDHAGRGAVIVTAATVGGVRLIDTIDLP